MSISSVNYRVPSEISVVEPVVSVSDHPCERNELPRINSENPLTTEERRQRMQESNTRYAFDQMIASVRRHNQEMQRQLQEQKEEDARNGYV